MITAYRALSNTLYFLASPFFRVRARGGDPVWRGRLLMDAPDGPVDIWIHAASAGEARMAAILIAHLRHAVTELKIHVTVMTPAGFDAARDAVPSDVSVSYFPLDIDRHVTRLYERLRPKVLVIAETEIWPNLVTGASHRHIPIVLINGRMSTRAFKRYKTIRRTFADLLARYDRFFLKSDEDMQRYACFGVTEEKARVTGDMKFDAPLAPRSPGRRNELRFRAGVADDQALVVAGSTRPGEEAMLLQAYRTILASHPHTRLLLAPRHLDRLGEVTNEITMQGFAVHTYGSERPGRGDEVILLDRMGILSDLYMAAEIAFVGGTLVALGGHNLLEPVWAGTPVLYGPSTENVAEAAAYIERHHFGQRVESADELAETVIRFLNGQLRFAQKNESDVEGSATGAAVHYIVGLLEASTVHA